MNARATVKWLAGTAARWVGVVGLNYHRIGDGRQSVFDRGLWSATEDDFDRQLRYLNANFDIISPRDVAYVVRVKRGRHVLLTFDDGYADSYTAAFPILKAHGATAAFFVATGYIDAPHVPWWDDIAWMVRTSRRSCVSLPDYFPAPVVFDEPDHEKAIVTLLRAYAKLPFDQTAAYVDAIAAATGTGRVPAEVIDVRKLWMSWDMLREMRAAGMTIGGHTVNHPILARMSPQEQEAEIVGCARRLREELGMSMRTFAYPVGSRDAFNEATRACLRSAGVQTAFSYYGGFRSLGDWDNFDIRRLAIEQDTTFEQFRAAVSFPWSR